MLYGYTTKYGQQNIKKKPLSMFSQRNLLYLNSPIIQEQQFCPYSYCHNLVN